MFKFDQVKSLRLPAQSKKKFYVVDTADPQRAGVSFTYNLKTLRSSSPQIFQQIDINLRQARKKKNAYDPLNSFKIAKSGRYVYSKRNLLTSFTKIKI